MRGRKRGAAAAAKHEEEDAIPIPADSVEEILHRLPSKHLLNLKLVCKDWLRLISSPEFIQKHLERSMESRIIVASMHSADMEIRSYCTNNLTLTTRRICMKGHVHLLGSCDGLVLYFDRHIRKIAALNPATGKFEVATPPPEIFHLSRISTWFGRHPATGEYVLVVIAYVKLGENKSIVFRVYALPRNSSLVSSLTEELDSSYSFHCHYVGTFLHGRVHVTAINVGLDADILVYDLQSNGMVRMWAPPPLHDSYCPALGVVDGCLCALNESEVWMMKEYGVKESWTKYANIDHKISIPLQVYPNDDVVLCDHFLKLQNGSGCFLRRRVVACIDSLVSPVLVLGRKA